MIRAVDVVVDGLPHQAGTAGGPVGEAPGDVVELTYDDRHRRRMTLRTRRGEQVLLDLRTALAIPHGARLVLEDGRQVEVHAASEPLIEVRADDPHHLARLAWHLGNRHVAAAIEPERILIRRDHVLAEMLAGLGAGIAEIRAPFDPEAGAYAHGSAADHRQRLDPAARGSDHHHHHGGGDEAGDASGK